MTVFELSRAGLPVRTAGPLAAALLLAASGLALWRRPLPLPRRRLGPFLLVLGLGSLLVAYPFLLHGFDWLSFCNDDMANYAMSAETFLGHGFFDPLDPRSVVENRNPALLFWADQMLMGARCGSELTLAFTMSLTRLGAHRVFMPVIVAFHLVLVCSSGALALAGRPRRGTALATCALVATSALTSLGTLYQMISQVLGLSLLAALGTLVLVPVRRRPRGAAWQRAALEGLLLAALGIGYPEVLPFLVLAWVLVHALALARSREAFRPLAAAALRAGLVAALLLNLYLASTVSFLHNQATKGAAAGTPGSVLFPFYLVPAGLGSFWGFLPIAGAAASRLADPAIALGGVLLLVAAATVVRHAARALPAAAVAAVMLGLSLRLAAARSDFGLFKLALFVQPFLLATLATACAAALSGRLPPRWRRLAFAPLAVLAALGLPAQVDYTRASAGLPSSHGGFVEIPGASRGRLVTRLEALGAGARRDVCVSDTGNPVLAKLESVHLSPSSLRFPSRNFIAIPGPGVWYRPVAALVDLLHPGSTERVARLWAERERWFVNAAFDLLDGRKNPFVVERAPVAGRPEEPFALVSSGPEQAVENRWRLPSRQQLRLVPSEEVRDHLVLVDSYLGKNYYLARRAIGEGRVARFQVEADPLVPGRTMSALGRTLLFRVLRPGPRLRILLDYSATYNADGRNEVPPAVAIGAQRAPFTVRGRGAARLVSPPIEPQTIEGQSFVSLDLGRDGQPFPEHRTGLMRLYGRDVPADSRRVTGFVRDISALSEEDHAALRPPPAVGRFPDDLLDRGLEFSGIYEDGWVSGSSLLVLGQPFPAAPLVVRLAVPGIPGAPTTLTVVVDGATVESRPLGPGENELRLPLPGAAARRRVELRFDRETRLTPPDTRIASALLRFAGFEVTRPERTEIAVPPLAIAEGWHPFERWEGETFRWVENDARLAVTAGETGAGVLSLELESGPGLTGRPFTLHVLAPSGSVTLKVRGRREVIEVPLRLAPGRSAVTLHVDGGGRRIPTDPRILNFRVFSASWTDTKTLREP